jgi:hypothetical protein
MYKDNIKHYDELFSFVLYVVIAFPPEESRMYPAGRRTGWGYL